jgi:hypothetical protein
MFCVPICTYYTRKYIGILLRTQRPNLEQVICSCLLGQGVSMDLQTTVTAAKTKHHGFDGMAPMEHSTVYCLLPAKIAQIARGHLFANGLLDDLRVLSRDNISNL